MAPDGRELATAGFEPDIYATKETAVREVARKLAKQYKQRISSDGEQPTQAVFVSGDFGKSETPDAVDDSRPRNEWFKQIAAEEVSDILGDGRPLSLYYSEISASQPNATAESIAKMLESAAAVKLKIDVLRESGTAPSSGKTGLLAATLTGPLGRYARQVAFANKPWSEDFERWRNTHGGSDWVEGQSDRLCTSPAEARAQAKANAVNRMIDIIVTRLEGIPASSHMVRTGNVRNRLRTWLGQVVPQQMDTGQFQTDTFTQKYERPYGTLYRCAVLARIPGKTSKTLIDAFFAHDRAYRTSWIRTVLSATGLLGLIVVVYLFLNAATRGYYVWSVRIAAGVLAVIGVWCVMMLA